MEVDTLRAGNVLAFEPGIVIDGTGLYLEDMILVTPTGAEVLTTGLPYTADEIEREMRSRPLQARATGRKDLDGAWARYRVQGDTLWFTISRAWEQDSTKTARTTQIDIRQR